MTWADDWIIVIARGEQAEEPHDAVLIEGGDEETNLRSVADSALKNAGFPGTPYTLQHRRSEVSWGASGATEAINLFLAIQPQQTIFDLVAAGLVAQVIRRIKADQRAVEPLTDEAAEAKASHAVGMTFEGRIAKYMRVVDRTVMADGKSQELVLEDTDGTRFRVRIEALGLTYLWKSISSERYGNQRRLPGGTRPGEAVEPLS